MTSKKKVMKHKCPLCNGKGELEMEVHYTIKKQDLKDTAERLRASGFTLREVAKMLGLKHPQTVKNLLK